MGLLEQQNFLARIFTDDDLRRLFLNDPETVGGENGLSSFEISQLKRIAPADLDFFAGSLVHKRLHEVEKLLPLTRSCLGDDFAGFFRQFSQTFQPQSIKKHLEDAIEFCRFIRREEHIVQAAKEIAKFEQTRHEFFFRRKALSFCVLKIDIFSCRKKYGLSVWYRFGARTRHFIL